MLEVEGMEGTLVDVMGKVKGGGAELDIATDRELDTMELVSIGPIKTQGKLDGRDSPATRREVEISSSKVIGTDDRGVSSFIHHRTKGHPKSI